LLERSCPESFGRREGLDISLPQIDLTQLEEAGAELIEGVAITTDVHVADAWVK
jgi:hypothetical protein